MSRKEHPLTHLVKPFSFEADVTPTTSGVQWQVTLMNNQGDHETVNGLAPVPANENWSQFWINVNGQLSWAKCKLLAAPIVRLITDPDTIEYIAAIPLTDRFKLYFHDYPVLDVVIQPLTMTEFAAVVHLCKIKYRNMQIGG